MNLQENRKLLFTPCTTRAHFKSWIIHFLKIDFPDCIVVEDESNSSPLDAAWEYYDRILRNDLAGSSKVMTYANRGGFKTLSAAVLETMALLHTTRNIGHMAAIEAQSKKSASYIKDFFRRPVLKDFVIGDNSREIKLVRFAHKKTGEILNEAEFSALTLAQQQEYHRRDNYLKIVVCTMAGANCVLPTTLVTKADSALVPAWSIEPGDEVRSFDTKTHFWVTNKVHKIDFVVKEMLELEFDNGGTVIVSEDHPVFSNSGFRRARALRKNMGFWFCGSPVEPDSLVSEVEIDTRSGSESDPWQVVWGSLLGDSSIQWPKNSEGKEYGVGPRVSCFHGPKQLELLENLREALRRIGIASVIFRDGDGFKLQSQPSALLVDTYRTLIVEGTKTVTRKFLDRLTHEGLAMWFADDGSGGPEDIGSSKGNSVSLATCGFSFEENRLIVDWLADKFDIDATVGTVSNQTKNVWPVIKMDKDSARKFSATVWSRVPPCVRYKLLVPNGWLDTFCVETGRHMGPQTNRTTGFRRSVKITKDQREWRQRWKLFSERFTGRLVSVRSVGSRVAIDLVLEAPPTSRNFVANNFLVLHNSDHVEFFVIDEVDVVPKQNIAAYHQAQNIPDPRDGMLPLTLLTSTRKSRTGLVQHEIDESDRTKLKIKHWNLIDVTHACEPARHKPEEPKQEYYINDDQVRHITKDQFEGLSPGEQKGWYVKEGYAGCKNCRIFAACKGRLATNQTSKSPMLKPISFAVEKFQQAPSPDFITTEYLCFTGDAQVTMSDGTLKPISEVKEGDWVITHLGNVQQVTGTMSRPYEGDLIAIEPGTRNKHWGTLRATPEHPFWVNGSFKEAKDLSTWHFDKWGGLKVAGDYLASPSSFTPKTQSISLINCAASLDVLKLESDQIISSKSLKANGVPQELELTYDFGWIVGYFLAEGSVIMNKNGTHKNLAFSSDRRETNFHQRVRDFFGTVYEHPTSSVNGYVQIVNSCIWSNIFNGLCGRFSDCKKIHPSLMSGPLPFQRGILDGFNAGDGTKSIVGGGELTTTSMQLASQLSVIAGRLGLCPRIQKLKPGSKKQAYRVYYSDSDHSHKQKRTKFKFKDGYNQYRLNRKTYEWFSGDVYNIEVAGDNSYIVNGVAVHNCRKPDASGLVYPRLSEDLHKKTANQMAAMVLAEDEVKGHSKTSLIQLLTNKGARFYTGMDFGFTHPFAIVTIATFGQYVFVLDCYSQPGLELDDQTANSEYIKLMFNNPRVYADPAYPGSIKTFSKRGFRMIDWEKKPFSVKAGIEIIRSLLMSGRGKTRLFFLSEDAGVIDKLWKNLKKYKLVVTNDGLPTEEPDGTDDDEADALRYVIMNVLGSKGALKEDTRTALTTEAHATPESKQPNSQQNWMTDLIRRETGQMSGAPSGAKVSGSTVKKNRFVWDG
jgi:hypothetical protein